MSFVKAERKKAKIKIAITGPSGAGKTYSALLMASGLGKNIAVIDTENASASLYDNLVDFKVKNLDSTSVEDYINAINEAVEAGFDVLVIDSLSHQWKTLLEEKTHVDARGGNSFTNWSKFTPKQDLFMNAILKSDIHIIATIRSKQEYALTMDGGKNKVQKLGMAPVAREGVEYEFGIVFDVAINHEAQASKDRTGLFIDKIFKITKETGETISDWLNSGKEIPPTLSDIAKIAKSKNIDSDKIKEYVKANFNIDKSTDLNGPQIIQTYQWAKDL